MSNYRFDAEERKDKNVERIEGKKQKFEIGTICVYGDYILTALSKFDEHNIAHLTMPEYLGFLISFWDKVNRVYAQKSVSVPIFGSGLTRIKGHKIIDEQDLLKIMLWTFRISEMRFKYPAKLTIMIHEGKIDKVNLLELKTARNGL
ncbi:macro domain-containing protein [Salmonella enterica subsp. enterica serovar Montevideo]